MNYFLLTIFLLNVPVLSQAKEVIRLYTYHNKAPFITDLKKEKGLSFDIANVLSKFSKTIEFKTEYIPRKRLDSINNKKVVLWSNPLWVKDPNQSKFLWTGELLKDSDIIIYNKNINFNFKTLLDLSNQKLVCVRGYYYPDLVSLFKNNHVERVDVNSENQVFKMVQAQRMGVSFGVMSLSTYSYLKDNKKLDSNEIRFTIGPMKAFYRRIFASKDMNATFQILNKLLKQKEVKKELNLFFKKYGLDTL
ncbi:MAG: hypothetical protein BM556_02870 [Bacteriovorax sp. MedPE-SWde]|nr:MAG: hypothetical protein BM556_02870 [Bacteriovorax sp. MedPE-SWde]